MYGNDALLAQHDAGRLLIVVRAFTVLLSRPRRTTVHAIGSASLALDAAAPSSRAVSPGKSVSLPSAIVDERGG